MSTGSPRRLRARPAGRYRSEAIAVIERRDGLITRFTEYFNPDPLRAAGVI